MAFNQPQLYRVCYDITDPKRLMRIHRFLRNEGLPVQYSVFTAQLTIRELKRVVNGLSLRMDPRTDDARVYPLPSGGERTCLGRQFFPEDVMLIENGVDLLQAGR